MITWRIIIATNARPAQSAYVARSIFALVALRRKKCRYYWRAQELIDAFDAAHRGLSTRQRPLTMSAHACSRLHFDALAAILLQLTTEYIFAQRRVTGDMIDCSRQYSVWPLPRIDSCDLIYPPMTEAAKPRIKHTYHDARLLIANKVNATRQCAKSFPVCRLD